MTNNEPLKLWQATQIGVSKCSNKHTGKTLISIQSDNDACQTYSGVYLYGSTPVSHPSSRPRLDAGWPSGREISILSLFKHHLIDLLKREMEREREKEIQS